MIKEDAELIAKLLNYFRSQTPDTISAMAHIKHPVFSIDPVRLIIMEHHNQYLPKHEKIELTELYESQRKVTA
jgi:hypothetical protein